MRKIIYALFIGITVLGLSACGANTSEDLQSNKWNVVATNGEAYTAEFGKNTVSFKIGNFTRGFNYEIDNGEISLLEADNEPIVFEVIKDGKEYMFKATNEEIKNQFGDLTLSPSKE
ncbi:hypothetical protein [Sporosarcina sp. Te-1]|uniref:hypothetical protein n=1 Tax=Sporosarcina sp. Te-1 TaxID=2818390 RepID=UPI001A9D9503|nr:hypothetical protein [Sporosarcina sp. Te-1]QTD39536.1 hypothetical protein J3U78_11725 [Sporosarcina sp. Te-1]